jgi:hypothetical protein
MVENGERERRQEVVDDSWGPRVSEKENHTCQNYFINRFELI